MDFLLFPIHLPLRQAGKQTQESFLQWHVHRPKVSLFSAVQWFLCCPLPMKEIFFPSKQASSHKSSSIPFSVGLQPSRKSTVKKDMNMASFLWHSLSASCSHWYGNLPQHHKILHAGRTSRGHLFQLAGSNYSRLLRLLSGQVLNIFKDREPKTWVPAEIFNYPHGKFFWFISNKNYPFSFWEESVSFFSALSH